MAKLDVWTLAKGERLNDYVKARCQYCRVTRYYLPGDLIVFLGRSMDMHELEQKFRCTDCGHKAIRVDPIYPSAADRMKLVVRRLVDVKMVKVPTWRDVKP